MERSEIREAGFIRYTLAIPIWRNRYRVPPYAGFTGAGGVSVADGAVVAAASAPDTAAGNPAARASDAGSAPFSSSTEPRRLSHGARLPGGRELFSGFWFSRSRASFKSSTTRRNTARANESGRLSSHTSSIWRKSKSVRCGTARRRGQ